MQFHDFLINYQKKKANVQHLLRLSENCPADSYTFVHPAARCKHFTISIFVSTRFYNIANVYSEFCEWKKFERIL